MTEMQVIRESLQRYREDHVETGGFLRSVLENDLEMAFARADADNRQQMFDIVCMVVNTVPQSMRGDRDRVSAHLASRPQGRE